MGLAASQGRMLTLFGRKSDIEYRGQMINNDRTVLSYQQEELARKYNEALNNRVLEIEIGDEALNLNVANLSLANLKPYFAIGDTAVGNDMSSKDLEDGLRQGTVYLKYINAPTEKEKDKKIDWRTSPNFSVKDRPKTEDDATANAIYESKSCELQQKDKRLEIELKNVDTQHNTVQTEIDAVKKVIDKNIDLTFKTFA